MVGGPALTSHAPLARSSLVEFHGPTVGVTDHRPIPPFRLSGGVGHDSALLLKGVKNLVKAPDAEAQASRRIRESDAFREGI